MKLYLKLRSGALVLTIIVALIFSILCSSIVLIGYYNRLDQQKNNITQRLIRDEESAINLILGDTSLSVSDEEPVNLFPAQKDSVKIIKGYWGIFRYAVVTTVQHPFSRRKALLFGSSLPDYMDGCLYLADHQRSLSLIGDTRLTGNAYLSNAGLKASYIDQRGYNDTKLLNDGEIKKSEENLPALRPEILEYLFGLLNNAADTNRRENNFNVIPGPSTYRSFSDSVLLYHYSGKVLLENTELKGHIIISSNEEIEIAGSARLENVLLVAPSIRFGHDFKGTVQAIARDSLIVEPGCRFDYPSAIILLKDTVQELQNILKVSENCKVNGVLISYSDKKDIYKSFIDIGANTSINGIIYTMGYLSLKGQVNGVVLTDFFIYKSSAAIYENHLVDVSINRKKLSVYFTGPAIFNNSKSQQVVSWVN